MSMERIPHGAIVVVDSAPIIYYLESHSKTSATGWRLVPVNQQVAVQAARLRAVYKLRLLDAIQVATAVVVGAHALITHDKAFAKIKEMPVVGV